MDQIRMFLLAFVVTGGTWAEESPLSQRSALHEDAIEAYRRGDTETAIARYQELAERERWNLDIRDDLMWLLHETEQYDRCADVAREILDLDAEHADAHSLLGQALFRAGRLREAVVAYESARARQPDRAAYRLGKALVLESLRDFAGAAEELEALRALHPERTDSAPAYARVLTALARHGEAHTAWTEAAAAHPDRPAYRFAAVVAQFWAGQTDSALAAMTALLAEEPDYSRCRDFLVNYDVVAGKFAEAINRQAARPLTGDATDAAGWVRLAALHLKADQPTQALVALNQALAADPGHGESSILKAEVLLQIGQAADASAWFEKVVHANPANGRAWRGLAAARTAVDDSSGAAAAIGRARRLDPTDPYLMLQEGRLRHAAGEGAASRQMLENWLAQHPDPALPILLYHGLTQRSDDPMLASRTHMTTAVFEDHMRALRAAGYQSISAHDILAWRGGERPLPPRAVWITFDDGRLDSLREATPILEAVDFRAAMFVAGANAGRNLPGYASWEELAAYREKGIWELQSHGDQASYRQPVAATGQKELFLPYRQWLEEEGRVETVEEWTARITAEYAGCREQMNAHVGVTPIAFAWPEGQYGQEGIPNAPQAARINLELVRENFPLAFHQDRYGMNLGSRDPALLTRREPDPGLSGTELVRALAEEAPQIQIRKELLTQSLADRDAGQARRWLTALRADGLSEHSLLRSELRVRYLEEDFSGAADTAEQLIEGIGRTNVEARLEALNTLGWSRQQLGRDPDALAAWGESLRLNPEQSSVWIAMATVFEQRRQFIQAAKVLAYVRANLPHPAKTAPRLAHILTALERHQESAILWTEAAAAFPDNLDYPYLEAHARFWAGDTTNALAAMQSLAAGTPPHRGALDFLVGHALAGDRVEKAISLLESGPRDDGAEGVTQAVRLAGLYLRTDRPGVALSLLDTTLTQIPDDGEILLLKAETLLKLERPADAAAVFKRVARANPNCRRAWVGLFNSSVALDQREEALAAIQHARSLDPADPYLLEKEADAYYRMGNTGASRDLLAQWLETNHGPFLTVLLYHGLSTRHDDPLLAAHIHMTTSTFADHLRALREAGYTSVTAEQICDWYAGNSELSAKPVWITFDDGRLDSFREATPLLNQYGFQAAMFVPGWNAARSLRGYASWNELARFHADGTWEIQSHGNLASSRIPINSTGIEGLFLPNLAWLDDEQRRESEAEWLKRIEEDYDAGIADLEHHVGVTPVAFAWPEGNYGQMGIPTAPGAAGHNLALVSKTFSLGFRQDGYGINSRSRDPILLSRLEPNPRWSGADLVRHLSDELPDTRIAMQLLKQATWESRTHEARSWLEELQRRRASTAQQLYAQAILRSAAGQQAGARTLVHEVLDLDPRHPASDLLDAIERRERIRVETGVRYWEDEDDRSSLILSASRRGPLPHDGYWTAELRGAEHRERGFSSIDELAPSLSAQFPRGLHQTLGATLTLHAFSGQSDARATGTGVWRTRWTDTLDTEFRIDRSPVYTVRALREDLDADRIQLAAWTRLGPQRRLSVHGSLTDYSDGNQRTVLAAELRQEIPHITDLNFILQARFEDTRRDSDAYYAPNSLVLGRLGLDYTHAFNASASIRLRYLPGYGDEHSENARILHAGHLDVTWQATPTLEIRPSFYGQKTPTYQSVQASLDFIWLLP